MELALSLLTDARLDCLIDAETSFEDLPGAMGRVAAVGGLCMRVGYSASILVVQARR
jgi:hypothetical protein